MLNKKPCANINRWPATTFFGKAERGYVRGRSIHTVHPARRQGTDPALRIDRAAGRTHAGPRRAPEIEGTFPTVIFAMILDGPSGHATDPNPHSNLKLLNFGKTYDNSDHSLKKAFLLSV